MRIYTRSFAAFCVLRSVTADWTTFFDSTEDQRAQQPNAKAKLRRGAASTGSRILNDSEPCTKQDGSVEADIFGGLFGGNDDGGKGKGGKGKGGKGGKGKGGKGKSGKRQRLLSEVSESAVKADLAGDSAPKPNSEHKKQVKSAQLVADRSEGREASQRLTADKVEPISDNDVLCADNNVGFVEQSSPQATPPTNPPVLMVNPLSPVAADQEAPSAPVVQPIVSTGDSLPNPGPAPSPSTLQSGGELAPNPLVSTPVTETPAPFMFMPFPWPTHDTVAPMEPQPLLPDDTAAPLMLQSLPTLAPAPTSVMFAPFPQQILTPPVPPPSVMFAPFPQPVMTTAGGPESISIENSDEVVIPMVPELVTDNPTSSPAEAEGCNDAFVYCPGRSTCLSNGLGWSIDLRTDLDLTILADCEIWSGVQDCDMATGKKVGSATVSRDLFHYCLDVDQYESNAFHLYAGKCVANDAGAQVRNGGVCRESLMQSHAGDFQSFTFVHEGGPALDLLTFDASHPINANFWSGSAGFPIGTETTEFLVAHVEACPVGVLESDPLFVQQATFPPTQEPTLSPTSLPTSSPTLSPTARPTALPSSGPSGAPTSGPSQVPSGRPSAVPTNGPTNGPTMKPTSGPTPIPTSGPTTAPTTRPSSIPTAQPTERPSTGPSVKPTVVPATTPSVLPSGIPSISPSQAPSSIPTTSPSTAPNTSPTPTKTPSFLLNLSSSVISGTATPQPTQIPSMTQTSNDLQLGSEQTSSPSVLPFIVSAVSNECEPGFVYCPGMSDCLSDVSGDSSARGWSIEYTGGVVEDCSIYVGVGSGCSMESAKQVGTFSLTTSTAHFCLDRNFYEAKSFHFYAGKCRSNDAGAHLRRGDECNEGDQARYGERWDTYPLKMERQTYSDIFVFDSSVKSEGEYWTNEYNVFNIGGPLRRYLSAHVDVCTVNQTNPPVTQSLDETGNLLRTAFPSSQPSKVTDVPTPKPTFRLVLPPLSPAPTSATPTAAPTSSAPTSVAPISSAPTSAAPTSSAPTSAAPTSAAPTSSAPTPQPIFRIFLPSPTDFPTQGPIERLPTEQPSKSPVKSTPKPTFRVFLPSPTDSPSQGPVEPLESIPIESVAPTSSSTFRVFLPPPINPPTSEPTVPIQLEPGEPSGQPSEVPIQPTRKPTFRVFFSPTAENTDDSSLQGSTPTEGPTLNMFQNGSSNETDPFFGAEGNADKAPTPKPSYHVYIPTVPFAPPKPTANDATFTDAGAVEVNPTATGAPTSMPKMQVPSPTLRIDFGEPGFTILPPTASQPVPSNTEAASAENSCEDAWVYCPGRSKCLNDPSFNDGNAAYAKDGSQNVWGWSIEYDPEQDGYIDDCVILIGGNDCDLVSAQQVGTFTLRNDFAHFCLDQYGYVSNEFGLYAGSCKGNDAGDSLTSTSCNPEEVAYNAAQPENFPLYKTDGPITINFTVDASDPINTLVWPSSHEMFPLKQKSYISGYTCVSKPKSPFVEQGEAAEEHKRFHWQWGWGSGFLSSSLNDKEGHAHI